MDYMDQDLLVQAGGGSIGDAYFYLLKYTMKEGLIMGIYKFLTSYGTMSEDSATESKVSFISEWVFGVWGDENKYYKVSKNIYTFLYDDNVGVCLHSSSDLCKKYLKYYWEFIMTINIFITFPLAHAAAVYDWYSLNKDRYDTVMSW